MKSSFQQIALRELAVFAGSSRFWLTFVAVVALFAITGPYDTAKIMSFPERLGYWFILHAATWAIAVGCIIIVDALLLHRISGLFFRILTGALLATVPIGLMVEAITRIWHHPELETGSYLLSILNSLPLTMVFSLLTFMAMGGRIEQAELAGLGAKDAPVAQAPQTPATPVASPDSGTDRSSGVPLLARLKPENRGPVLLLSVEDHYVNVTTSRGRELILLRFSDALKETGTSDGLQVHRSFWVARSHVEKVRRQAGKITLILRDQQEIPVSRPYAEAVRQAFPGPD